MLTYQNCFPIPPSLTPSTCPGLPRQRFPRSFMVNIFWKNDFLSSKLIYVKRLPAQLLLLRSTKFHCPFKTSWSSILKLNLHSKFQFQWDVKLSMIVWCKALWQWRSAICRLVIFPCVRTKPLFRQVQFWSHGCHLLWSACPPPGSGDCIHQLAAPLCHAVSRSPHHPGAELGSHGH